MDEVKDMANCKDCTRYKEKSCPYDYDYLDKDYAEDCMGYSEPWIEALYSHCDTCDKVDTCKSHLTNPNISGCKNFA